MTSSKRASAGGGAREPSFYVIALVFENYRAAELVIEPCRQDVEILLDTIAGGRASGRSEVSHDVLPE